MAGIWSTPAAAGDAQDLFQEAQRAFRAGDLAAAVTGYREADRAGFADPVLHFNLGVAHYRLGQHDEASAAFLTASATPKLAAISFYNLGLVARRAGDTREARAWFEQARRHPLASAKIQALAREARASLPEAARRRPAAYAALEGPRLSDHLRFFLHTGFASDSNVYRSPSDSYVDLSDPAAPTVDPVVQSGTYVPVAAAAEVRWGTHDDANFKVRYDLEGRFYSDARFSNANELEHRVSLGGNVDRTTRRGGVRWHSYFTVTRSEEKAYDRDTGLDQFAGAENVADRFSYTRFGPRASYHRDIGRFGFGLRMDAYISRYDETVDFLDLTHEQYLAGAHLTFRPLRNTELRISGDYYQRLYADRVAKDVDGVRFTNNEDLEYHYRNYGFTVRQRLGRALDVSLDYRYTQREDVFENYDDYDRHSGRAVLRYRNKRLTLRAGYTHRIYDFPNAFAFDEPTAGERTLDTSYATFDARFRVSRHFDVELEATRRLVESSDPRSEYNRNRIAVGLTWHL